MNIFSKYNLQDFLKKVLEKNLLKNINFFRGGRFEFSKFIVFGGIHPLYYKHTKLDILSGDNYDDDDDDDNYNEDVDYDDDDEEDNDNDDNMNSNGKDAHWEDNHKNIYASSGSSFR